MLERKTKRYLLIASICLLFQLLFSAVWLTPGVIVLCVISALFIFKILKKLDDSISKKLLKVLKGVTIYIFSVAIVLSYSVLKMAFFPPAIISDALGSLIIFDVCDPLYSLTWTVSGLPLIFIYILLYILCVERLFLTFGSVCFGLLLIPIISFVYLFVCIKRIIQKNYLYAALLIFYFSFLISIIFLYLLFTIYLTKAS